MNRCRIGQRHVIIILWMLLLASSLPLVGQALPPGWSMASHSAQADGDYAEVFPSDRILAITVTLGQGAGMPFPPNGNGDSLFDAIVSYDDRVWHDVQVSMSEADRLAWQQGLAAPDLILRFNAASSTPQRFYGFSELVLYANREDPTLVRTKVALDLLAAAGVPAPRSALCRLHLEAPEGRGFVGIYTLIETPAAPMLDVQFDDNDGALYVLEGDATRLDSFNPASSTLIQPANPAHDAPTLEAVIDALHANGDNRPAWSMGLESVFDVHEFLRCLAVRIVSGACEGYGRSGEPVTVYWDPGDRRFHWIAQPDLDRAFQVNGELIDGSLDDVDEAWPLIRLLANDPAYRGTYHGYIDEALDGVLHVARVHDRLRRAHALVAPVLLDPSLRPEDCRFLPSQEAFFSGLEDVLWNIEERYAQALDYLLQCEFNRSAIVISEIHYNPSLEQGIDNNFEFVELFNRGYQTVDLSGYMFIEGLQFALPPRTVLSPGQCLLLTKRAETYRDAPCDVQQWDRGSLSNGGETLRLIDRNGVEVDSVRYDDVAPWPEAADAGGSSLEIIDPNEPNYTYDNWRASLSIGGSPGWVER